MYAKLRTIWKSFLSSLRSEWKDYQWHRRFNDELNTGIVGGTDRSPSNYWRNDYGLEKYMSDYDNSDRVVSTDEAYIKMNEARKRMHDIKANSPSTLGSSAPIGSTIREPSRNLRFVYKNWRGVIKEYTVVPIEFVFDRDHYHTETQWLMHAIDIPRGCRRTFALNQIIKFL